MLCGTIVALPGDFGTLDEVFEMLTLIQTGKIKPLPAILLGRDYRRSATLSIWWNRVPAVADLTLFNMVETTEEAWSALMEGWEIPDGAIQPPVNGLDKS